MKKTISISAAICLVVIVVILSAFLLLDNTTENVVSEENTQVTILVDEYSENNSVNAQLIIENHNGFDINMLDVYCSNNNAYLDIENESASLIEDGETFSCDFTITFNDGNDSEDYLSLIEEENILVSFNASAANQNDDVTQIKPEIKQ